MKYFLRYKKGILTPVFLVLWSFIYGQLQRIELANTFDTSLEISAILPRNNEIYLLSEKCKRIFVLSQNDFTISKIIDLNRGILLGQDVEFEGMALYKSLLFFTNEKNIGTVYSFDFSDSSVFEIECDYSALKNDEGSTGMEGISVYEAKNKAYILKEKNGNSESEIYVFNIILSDNKVKLQLAQNVIIKQPDNQWRYSDLIFNVENSYLYCLKTRFIFRGASENQYQVDTIKVNQEGLIDNTIIELGKRKLFVDISESVNVFHYKGYETNLEGIAIIDNNLYLVSDNKQQQERNCNILGDGKTLLLKMSLRQ
jgi:uncharacterized protein YjiK